ncbi:MAG: hypothetical protein IGR93_02815 [Hydrococcus sp. C42_A2020_068]|nr:hypothetical protein [Hydrococcus sp. C42_A2020_068]
MAIQAIEHLTDEQIDDLHRLYQDEWWSRSRKRADIEGMLPHSDLIVAFCDSDSKRRVAFSRILTDSVYRAVVFDVIVEPTYRGNGLEHILMDAIAKFINI